jgi:hypothetical protein
MAALGAQLDAIDDEHARPILRRIRRTRTVAVIGQHDEIQAGLGRGGGRVVR